MGGNRGRDHPQSVQQRRTIPQSPCGRQLPLHKGAFGDGDTDCRVASLLAMTVLILCHSEEAQRADVGIRPFLRWTGVRAAVPRAWPPPTKFPSEIWGVGQVVGPYGEPNQPPKPASAQRSVCASGREGWAGIDARTIPKEGPLLRPPRQRLAKRKARKEQLVKFGLCPIISECSTAYKVRKPAKSPARAHADITSTEQNSLEPRPAARQGASRARNCAAKSVFSFDGSTAVFFLALQKENGGGKPAGLPRHPRSADRPTGSPGAAGDWTGRGKDDIINYSI